MCQLAHTIFIFAVLERWLIYDCETECSFLVYLIKTYCLPRLLYGCELWPTETVDMQELDVIWNNGFRHI